MADSAGFDHANFVLKFNPRSSGTNFDCVYQISINSAALQKFIQFVNKDHSRHIFNTMRINIRVFGLLFLIGIFCHASGEDYNLARPVQIVSHTENHSFQLELSNLKRILEADEIKNRDVVVVSIAGAFRKGKSFLLNFFIRYLEAQVTISSLQYFRFKNLKKLTAILFLIRSM